MSTGIRNRLRSLPGCDRILLLVIGGWSIVGMPANYLRVRGQVNGNALFWLLLTLWATVAGVTTYSVVRKQRRLADYGFSFRSGGLVSLAILAVVHVYLVLSGKFVLSATDSLPWITLGAFMEELGFRAILIDKFVLLMDGIQAKAFWAILASSVIFSIPHIPSKSAAQLLGLFSASLILGYVYYKSRSILLPAWIHGIANAGYAGGTLIVAVYCFISAADWAVWSWNGQTPLSVNASRDTKAVGA